MTTKKRNIDLIQSLELIFNPDLKKEVSEYLIQKNSIHKEENSSLKTKKEPVNPYVPKKTTFAKLASANEELAILLRGLSPFIRFAKTGPDTVEETEIEPKNLFKKIIPFTQSQIDRMNLDTKEQLINANISGIKETLKKYRDWLLDGNKIMFEDTFETERLQFLFNQGQEPIIFNEKDYEYIEEIITYSILKILRFKFGITEFPKYPSYIEESYIEKDYYLIYEIHIKLLKRFECLEKDCISRIGSNITSFLSNGNKLTIEESIEFKEFKACPLVSEPVDFSFFTDTLNGNVVGLFATKQLVSIAEELHELMHPKDFEETVLNHLLSFSECIKKLTHNKSILEVADDSALELILSTFNTLSKLKQLMFETTEK
ncbi:MULTISPECIES: hypothetical protein [Bacillus cereus group]|uniref:hypothetical protein n=1 Tax=Bacillus cereus group TaxID=86661 RepID=UPI0022E88C04|nr:hypothetical protein [Bacillus cereus group sp. TH152-1LC]MDA1674995.1 hypothetical protein [Bacillus cereus group sp. TH152-1LC]